MDAFITNARQNTNCDSSGFEDNLRFKKMINLD